MSKKINDKNLVVKSNALIESRSKLSLVEQKIVLSVVSMIEPEDKDFKPYIFKITDFMESAGLTGGSAYKRIREISKGIVEKGIEIINKKENTVLQTTWFSSVLYRNNEGTVDIQVSPELKPYLLGLKREFTEYQLKNVMKLKSQYSIRIYELLKQYKFLGERIFKIKDLKHILKIPEGNYKKYNDFKKKVLLVAQRELLEKTDLNFEFEEIKNGRKVDKIKFIINSNGEYIDKLELPKTINTNKNIKNIPQSILDILPDKYHINSIFKLINKYLSKSFNEEYIISNIIYTSNHSSNNFPAYFAQALENDYASADREQEVKQKKAEQKRIAKEKAKKKQEEKKEKALIKAVENLSEDKYKSLENEALKILNRFAKKSSKQDPNEIKYMMVELYRHSNK